MLDNKRRSLLFSPVCHCTVTIIGPYSDVTVINMRDSDSQRKSAEGQRMILMRKPYTSTTELPTWSETSPSNSLASVSVNHYHQPSDGINKMVSNG